MQQDLYDALIRLALKPGQDFEFATKHDKIMRARGPGVRKLVARRFWVNKTHNLHVSLIPNDNGVVDTALISTADEIKRPGFWHVILDASGRPVAEHPLTWSARKINPSDPPEPASGNDSDQPPSGTQAVNTIVETTGELTRLLVSWLEAYTLVNDDDIAIILEILSVHAESPREVRLEIKSRAIAQRFHDELLCFEDDVSGIPDAIEQASALRARIARLLKEFPV